MCDTWLRQCPNGHTAVRHRRAKKPQGHIEEPHFYCDSCQNIDQYDKHRHGYVINKRTGKKVMA